MPRIPVGDWVATIINWMTDHFAGLFDAVSSVVQAAVSGMLHVLTAPPSLVMIVLLAIVAYLLSRSVGLVLFTIIAFLLVDSMGLWYETMQSLSIVNVSVLTAIVVGLPVGILAGLNNVVSAVVRPLLDLSQALPVFVYLIPAVFFFGIGNVPGVVATIVFAIAPAVRMTELGIRQVDGELVEAVQAFGATRRQVLREVQLPMATPSIMAGINQVIMLALSMVVVAGLVGAAGLGTVVVQGVSQLDVAAGFEGGLSVVVLAIYLDRVTGAAGHRLRPGRARTAGLLNRLRRAPQTGASPVGASA
jgi:glycine betaine/proline transport system permease protein